MKQVNLLVMPTLNKDNIFREYELICRELKKQNGSKKARKYLARSFLLEMRRIISGLPKAQLRGFAEKTSEFLGKLQSEGMLDLRNFSAEEGYDLMRLLYDVQGFYEDKIQADTPRMAMEFLFPYHMFPQGSKVVIYGAGNVGRLIYRQAVHDGYVKIVGIVDKNYEGMSAPDLPVKPLSAIKKLSYDYVLISIRESAVAYNIRKDLERIGVQSEKIRWDGTAVFRDEFYRNFYFPLLNKMKDACGSYKSFLNNVSKMQSHVTVEKPELNYGYYESIKPLIEAMPDSNGSRYYQPLKKTIGWIADPFAYDAYLGAAPGILINPEDWNEQIGEIDWLLVVSGWRGFHDEWVGFATPGSKKQKLICEIVEKCNELGIPTVFYSKEDPVSYEQYIGIAKVCRYIFTSAEEKISDYIKDCGHERVYGLKFSLNPQLHNPIGMRKFAKKNEVVFAGSWYGKFAERCADTETVFDGVLQAGRFLRIIDRNILLDDDRYRFPSKYAAFLTPPIEHKDLQKVHKLYDWAININSVKDSQTMFANRTYELMGNGNLLISNYSAGINSLLPEAFLCQKSKEIPSILNCLTEEEVYEHQVAGVRFAYRENTCYERLHQITSAFEEDAGVISYNVAVVANKNSKTIKQMFENQSYPYKELLTEDELIEDYDKYDMVAFFKESSYYGDFYLEDMINGFKYTNCDYITKDGYYEGEKYIHGTEHDYVSVMQDKFRTVFWARAFTVKKLLGMRKNVSLPNGYSIDHFMFNEKNVAKKKQKNKPLLSVIVPVYNNGMHLYGKCFSSLRRSSIFHQMEIILVDDGSTDNYTSAVVRTLEHDYPNVRSFFFSNGGSGSASRPRNKGVKMSKADYITYLDPDNEAINDAYAKMLSVAKNEELELVVGSVKIFDTEEKPWNLEPIVRKHYNSDLVDGGKDLVESLSYQPMSIQAMVIKKKLLTSTGIEQVEGAIGEDTLFSWQLFYYAKQVKFVPLDAHIYYAGRSTSIVNNVTARFFEKYLPLERERINWLLKSGMMESHMKIRFASFFKYWYLKNLACVVEDDKERCEDILHEIVAMYGDNYKFDDETVNKFIRCESIKA